MKAKLCTAYAVLKLLLGIALLPALVLTFLVWKRAFIAAMTFLWVHLDIYTPEGELYLRRWFMTPKFRSPNRLVPHPRFLHLIKLSDGGRDPHDHPGAFTTTILWNGYDEEIYFPRGDYIAARNKEGGWTFTNRFGRPGNPLMRKVRAYSTYENSEVHTHRVKLIGPTLSWVVGWKKGKPWGFWILDQDDPSKDRWVDSETYGEKGIDRKSWTIDGN